jgi:RNA recognition motif-containing protein
MTMAKRLYVGNLPYDVTADDLRELFSKVGTVEDVHLPTDRQTGRPRGFAFVEMATDEQAKAAIHRYDGYTLDRRTLRVNVAQERELAAGGYVRRGR